MAERVPRVATRREEVVVSFVPTAVRAPFSLRCAALIIDYLLIVFTPVMFLLLARFFGNDGTGLLNGQLNNTGWLIAVLIAVTDLVVLPLATGQSAGKLFTGLRIVSTTGSQASYKRIFFRQTLGYLVTVLTLGLGFLICALNRRGRALHDFMIGTLVIQGEKRRVN